MAKNRTIHDVARAAGVSIAAVSQAMNGKGTLSQATREHIVAVAARLDYRADALARGLRRAPLGVVGIVVRPLDAQGTYQPDGVDVYGRVIASLAAAALEAGKGAVVLPDLTHKPLPPLSLSLDGYVVVDPLRDDRVLDLLDSHEIPYVTVGRVPGRDDFRWWVTEDEAAAMDQVLTAHVAAGARSVALVSGLLEVAWNADSETAYLTWCHEHGMTPQLLRAHEADGVDGGRAAVGSLLEDGMPDAVHCLTGRHAAGVQQELLMRGLRVPEDVMVSTGSDAEPARQATPPISAVVLGQPALGPALVGALQRRLDGQDPGTPQVFIPEYVQRASTRRT